MSRFLNTDGQLNSDLLGCNLYVYCGNNPVMRADESGQGWWVIAGAVIGGIVGSAAKVLSNVATGKKWNDGVIGAALGGAAAGAIITATGDANVVFVNKGWAVPSRFKSSFVGKKARRVHGQSAVQGVFDATVNMMMDLQGFLGNVQTGQSAIVILYPIMQVGPAR